MGGRMMVDAGRLWDLIGKRIRRVEDGVVFQVVGMRKFEDGHIDMQLSSAVGENAFHEEIISADSILEGYEVPADV